MPAELPASTGVMRLLAQLNGSNRRRRNSLYGIPIRLLALHCGVDIWRRFQAAEVLS